MTRQTKAGMNTEVGTNYPDNTSGLITPAIARTTFADVIDSFQQAPIVRAVTGTTDTIAVTDYGNLVTYSNSSAIAVTIPQATGNFATFNFFAINLGPSAVTFTPTTSTINGAATLVLMPGRSIKIVSDGTNYQINSFQRSPTVRAVTGTSDTIAVADHGNLITYSNAGAIAITLPQATGAFANFNVFVVNRGVGTATITPTTSQINGASTLALTTNKGIWIVSDGTNYQIWPGAAV